MGIVKQCWSMGYVSLLTLSFMMYILSVYWVYIECILFVAYHGIELLLMIRHLHLIYPNRKRTQYSLALSPFSAASRHAWPAPTQRSFVPSTVCCHAWWVSSPLSLRPVMWLLSTRNWSVCMPVSAKWSTRDWLTIKSKSKLESISKIESKSESIDSHMNIHLIYAMEGNLTSKILNCTSLKNSSLLNNFQYFICCVLMHFIIWIFKGKYVLTNQNFHTFIPDFRSTIYIMVRFVLKGNIKGKN